MRYIIGAIIIGLCIVVVWKSKRLGEIVPIPWAEEKFPSAGQAGTTTFYRLAAVSIMVLTVLFMLGVLQGIIIAIFT